MRSTKPKYPLLPMYIHIQQNGRYQDTITGRWIGAAELNKYAAKPQQNKQQNNYTPSHEAIIAKRWYLRY